jgi:molybdate transport system ATP-binding protein
MQLGHLRERRILELSRGEQRRVLIARALAFRPALLLLDEPASGLDARAREDLETMLDEVAALTTTVTAVHASAELPAIVNRVTAIRSGRLTPLAQTQAPEDAAASTATAVAAATPTATATSTATAHPRDGSDRPAAAAAARPRGRLMIELRQASVWLDGRRILEPLDWQLREGEHWLVRGPNGAGKSTLLRLLHAEIRPERGGTLRWPGLGDPADVWALRRQIALVSPELQARYLFPTRVFDAVASGFTASIGRTREPTPEEQARVRALLAAFELEPLAARPLRSLSYGQRHRTLIARTLATEPRVLLLDEPWEGIDAQSTGVICRELRRVMQTGTQIVCVSHLGARGLPLNRSLSLGAGRILSARDSAAPTGSSASERWRAADCPQR